MPRHGTVLVTGAAGRVAGRVMDHLADCGYGVTGLDRPGSASYPRCSDWFEGDVTHHDDVARAAAGAEMVVHTAALFPEHGRSGVDLLSVNVGGAYNVLDAARQQAMSKVVLISEAPVHLPPESSDDGRTWRSSSGSDHAYDLSKRLQEDVARDFCETFGMSVIALRIGHVVDGSTHRDLRGHPLRDVRYSRGGWVCCHDVARACVAALQADLPGFTALPVVGSLAGRRRFGVGDTERMLGVQLREGFDAYE